MFDALGTQWNVGPQGAVGLRYEALPVVFDTLGIGKKKRAALFEALRIMEDEALQVIREHGQRN